MAAYNRTEQSSIHLHSLLYDDAMIYIICGCAQRSVLSEQRWVIELPATTPVHLVGSKDRTDSVLLS